MDFFKRNMKETNVKDTRLVGAVVPTNIFYYFNLFCVVDKRSKSSIIRPFIEEWAEEAIKEFPEKKLIRLAAEMGYASWENRKNQKRPFQVILSQQERELRKKGIQEETVLKIIQKIQDTYNKERSDIKIKRIIQKQQRLKRQYDKSNKGKE